MDTKRIHSIIGEEIAKTRGFLGAGEASSTALLPILHALQAEFGYIGAQTLPLIAEELNISQAEVRGVVSFYHDFRLEPAGRHTLKICRAEACQSLGCEHMVAHLRERHAIGPGQTLPDGSVTLENVYCLGNCALGPAAMLDGDLIGRVDEKRLDAIMTGAR
jgi:formate dehydrogenase subunit gamma